MKTATRTKKKKKSKYTTREKRRRKKYWKKSVHANAYRLRGYIRAQHKHTHTDPLNADLVISPVNENACALVCARSLFYSSLRFRCSTDFSLQRSSSISFCQFLCTFLVQFNAKHYSNWMQLATVRLFYTHPFVLNHLRLGNASKSTFYSFFFSLFFFFEHLLSVYI